MAQLIDLAHHRARQSDKRLPTTSFTHSELSRLMQLYARQVMHGEWRDYAIDTLPGLAVFSVFRHTRARPLFAVVKQQLSGQRTPEFLLLEGAQVIKRTPFLEKLIHRLEKKLEPVER